MRTITQEQKKIILEQIHSSRTYAHIARNAKVGVATVKRYARMNGVRRSDRGV